MHFRRHGRRRKAISVSDRVSYDRFPNPSFSDAADLNYKEQYPVFFPPLDSLRYGNKGVDAAMQLVPYFIG